jgi:hypothetical protein
MKILFVSNYEPWGLVAKGLMPSNHLFGIKEALTGLNEKKQDVGVEFSMTGRLISLG